MTLPLAELGDRLAELQQHETAVAERIQRSAARLDLERAEVLDIRHTQNNLRAAVLAFVTELEELTEAVGG